MRSERIDEPTLVFCSFKAFRMSVINNRRWCQANKQKNIKIVHLTAIIEVLIDYNYGSNEMKGQFESTAWTNTHRFPVLSTFYSTN